ncbi:type II toxin-antitoxin system VapC family toxin [Flexivirga meconopsidis]|uniref:type II toxin-antitoxin system VapC family toxin n=1 Tax=Flexivirga meconopsidis TaxID=2977121 RepID=UPI002240E0D3|nr:PIN domain nuclease [Flexivirga meconopsidis]
MIVIDSSAWIEFLRGTGSPVALRVRALLRDPSELALVGTVALELLCGATNPRELEAVRQLTKAIPVLAVDERADYESAADIYRAARAIGRPVRKVNDCLIAAVVLRHGASLVHRDADFTAIAEVVPLRHEFCR